MNQAINIEHCTHEPLVEGVKKIELFNVPKQARIIKQLTEWYQENKLNFPRHGFVIGLNRERLNAKGTEYLQVAVEDIHLQFGLKIPLPTLKLISAIAKDSQEYTDISERNPRILFERTGTSNTHIDDRGFHLDTSQIYFDSNGNRIGYSEVRSLDIYAVFAGRPGSVVVHGRVDPNVSWHESVPLGRRYRIDPISGDVSIREKISRPEVSHLLPDSIYKIAAGDLFHCPPAHEDGLLITVRF